MHDRIMVVMLATLLTGCGLPGNVVVLMPDEAGGVGTVRVAANGQQRQLSEPYAGLGTGTRDKTPFVTHPKAVQAEFAGALAAKPRPADIHTVYFLLGQAEIDPASADSLTATIAAARRARNPDISVIGHSDATGDEQRNQELSLQRANVIRDALVAGGVYPAAIEIGYHGSNNPAVAAAHGVPEPRNRRVEVTIR